MGTSGPRSFDSLPPDYPFGDQAHVKELRGRMTHGVIMAGEKARGFGPKEGNPTQLLDL